MSNDRFDVQFGYKRKQISQMKVRDLSSIYNRFYEGKIRIRTGELLFYFLF